ncbi:MAG: hypothetical protein J0I14_07530 [Propionibacteriaceae bacterium]|nr:hypothetical protein [Propionibacteriaceae bacterium]
MALFTRPPRLDAALVALLGGRRVLASASSPDGEVVGTVDRLFFPDGSGWSEQPWHEVERGGWDGASRTLAWTTTSGVQRSLVLTERRGLPDLFNERVTATIVATRDIELGPHRKAILTGRRDLSPGASGLVWQATPGRGTTAAELASDPLVIVELERLRAEYDGV